MTAASPAPSPLPTPLFIGREPEGRAIILSVRAGRCVQLVAPSGYGKSALLAELAPTLEQLALVLCVPKAAPFGTFVADLADALFRSGVSLAGGDLPGWKKAYAVNDLKAPSLCAALHAHRVTALALIASDWQLKKFALQAVKDIHERSFLLVYKFINIINYL